MAALREHRLRCLVLNVPYVREIWNTEIENTIERCLLFLIAFNSFLIAFNSIWQLLFILPIYFNFKLIFKLIRIRIIGIESIQGPQSKSCIILIFQSSKYQPSLTKHLTKCQRTFPKLYDWNFAMEYSISSSPEILKSTLNSYLRNYTFL